MRRLVAMWVEPFRQMDLSWSRLSWASYAASVEYMRTIQNSYGEYMRTIQNSNGEYMCTI